MKTIKLTQGKVTLVDDDVYEWASKLKWRSQKGGAINGSWPNDQTLHRRIMEVDTDEKVFHKNGDVLDNRRKNLRSERVVWVGKTGYAFTTVAKSHPFRSMTSSTSGQIPQHRLVMALHLGRPLKSSEIIHHINGVKTDNRIENLEVTTNGKHIFLHVKERRQFKQLKNRLLEARLEKIAEQALL